MGDRAKPVVNIDELDFKDFGNGEGFQAKLGRIGERIGAEALGCMLTIVEPGKKAFPYHVHHAMEEMFVLLEGTGEYRFGAERYPIRAGDVLAAPAGGPEVAHQIINTGDVPLKYLGLSTKTRTEVVEYPDSKKFAVNSRFDWSNPDGGGVRFIGRSEGGLDYWDGEDE
ncbi:MAG: cupin domain-containing protein [Alphaproteobacteria bacterium]